jgi:predicted O-methyltransferase YrrM
MPLFSAELTLYLDNLVPDRPAGMLEMEARAAQESFPIIGPASGQACYVLARLANAKNIFELGSGYGYSTAWFAKAVKENGGGVVHHVVWDEQLSKEAQTNLDGLGFGGIVKYQIGEALSALEMEDSKLDLIFCDIDKEGYPQAIELSSQKLATGGLFIIDNMLWSGAVLTVTDQSPATQGIRKATELL